MKCKTNLKIIAKEKGKRMGIYNKLKILLQFNMRYEANETYNDTKPDNISNWAWKNKNILRKLRINYSRCKC